MKAVSIRVFGLTGGIGSGKSAVAKRFRDRTLPVIDADLLAREVVAPGTDGLGELAKLLGEQILTDQGALDRGRVADLVFSDPNTRERVNAIIHPRIRALARARFAALEEDGHPLGCYEVPLLFEKKLEDSYRPVVVVVAKEPTCIARVMARDGSSESQARARMQAQLPLEEKARRADFVIDNEGALSETWRRTDEVFGAICERLGVEVAKYPLPQ